ncbi:putative F-box/WD-repeat protein pof1, partial [Operophtera brumata]
MAAAFQQQIFALDARFNAYRAPNNPNFKTLYIRRRSQLLRENAKFKDIDTIKKYLNVRSQLLQRRYGVQDNISISSSSSRARSSSKASLAVEDSPSNTNTKRKNDMTISENYAFTGVHHIFDQHAEQVSVVKFANNDRSKLACASDDGSVSIYCDWSASNELLVTCGLDGCLALWNVGARSRLRLVRDQLAAPLLCCVFQPANNNMAGNARGMVAVLNISTGIYPRGGSSVLGGRVMSIACESSGRMRGLAQQAAALLRGRRRHVPQLVAVAGAAPGPARELAAQRALSVQVRAQAPLACCGAAAWAAASRASAGRRGSRGTRPCSRACSPTRSICSGEGSGTTRALRRCCVGGGVTCLSWSPWLARHPALLASAQHNALYLFRHHSRAAALLRGWRRHVPQLVTVAGAAPGPAHERAAQRALSVQGTTRALRRCCVGGGVTCLSWSPWLARHPALLTSAQHNALYLFRISDREGSLTLKKRFDVSHTQCSVKSTFCPIMSFRRGVCVVSGSEDSCVYFLDIEGHAEHPVVNKLQGHASPVLGVSFSYDESLLATSDLSGLLRREPAGHQRPVGARHHLAPLLTRPQHKAWHASPVLGVSFSYDESLLATSDLSGL